MGGAGWRAAQSGERLSSFAAQTIAAASATEAEACRVCVANAGDGDDRDRTGDPLLAKQVLSQLSYSPLNLYGGPG